jgi:hypothetical protein
MAEYVMGPDDNQADVARDLMRHAGDERAHEIQWSPRPNVPGGGVFSMPDDLAEGYSSDRVSRLDDDVTGARIQAATDGATAPQADPTEFNQKIAAGEAAVAASPATGENPVAHLQRDEQDGDTDRSTTSRARRQAAKANAAKADTSKE